MASKIIRYCFYLLFFLTPLIFLPYNSELFEFNKMMLVYILTIIIAAVWLMEMVSARQILIRRTPLDLPLMFFLGSQILSTIFSIDPHTSIWGYYSRSNGGLLSTLSYIILYYAFVSHFDVTHALKMLKAALLGGLIVSLYAIPEHFGISPSCIILANSFSADCWVQDVQARVFATLGQPNWLAAYLAMLIFPALYFLLTAKNRFQATIYYLLSTIYYLAFTFTYARGATLGLLVGFIVLIVLHFGRTITRAARGGGERGAPVSARNEVRTSTGAASRQDPERKAIFIILGTFLLINFLFGSALTRFRLITQAPPPPKPTSTTFTQLETGGTESGQIRLIVWQGALEIFKAYPLFGSGVETFAYSYYNFRPASHNLVSEWDFLYNKAHNEYLNYLATTGIVGLGSYSIIIITFIIFIIRAQREFQAPLILRRLGDKHALLLLSLLASYISYLVQNIFGFSVVMIALLFFLFPAIAISYSSNLRPVTLPTSWHFIKQLVIRALYRRPIYPKIAQLTVIILTLSLIFSLARLWIADSLFKKGGDFAQVGNVGQAYNYLSLAVSLNGTEPIFRSDLAFAAASAALALAPNDASTSARLTAEADEHVQTSIKQSPRNLSVIREAVRTYYQLSLINPKFEPTALEMIDRAISLAPTDAKLYYNKGLMLSQSGKNEPAIEALKKTIELKPNYRDGYFSLGLIYEQTGQQELVIAQMEQVLKLVPGDTEATKKLEELRR